MDDQNLIIDAFEELSPRYEAVVDAELNRFWGLRYSDFVETLLDLTPIFPEDRILDIATGTGVIPTNIASRHGSVSSLHGLDITFGMLKRANAKYTHARFSQPLRLTCASAMEMPYANHSYDLVLCGLATHHMDVATLISEIYRVLDEGGRIAVADAGSSPMWNIPGVKLLLRIGALIYFTFKENPQRAWAEAIAVSNIRTKEEWYTILKEAGFEQITIRKLKSKYRWIPDPLVFHAIKTGR
ncbi:methyltransferase domain-containing protein [bacterium]|nr:methyltransferase domain-containing protein [bacterium]